MAYKDLMLKFWPPVQSILVVFLVMTSGVLLAKSTWLVLDTPPAVSVPKVKAAKATDSSGSTDWSGLSRRISQRSLFGEIETVVREEVQTTIEAPETSLNLTLLAILAGSEGEGFAIIGQAKSSGEVFGIGDDLYGKANLSAVYSDRVILDRNGKLEALHYEKVKSNQVLQAVPASEADSDSIEGASSFREAMSRANKAVSEGGDMATQVQGVMSYVTARANSDPEAFIKELGLEVTDQGYQVSRKARQLQMVGLRPGDVINSVNDVPVGDVSTDQALLNQVMQTGGELKIQITRGSRSLTIYQTIPAN